MSNNQNNEMLPDSMEDSRTAQERFTSSAFSGELDADDLAFLSDQQSEMIVGGDGYAMNGGSGIGQEVSGANEFARDLGFKNANELYISAGLKFSENVSSYAQGFNGPK